MTDGSSISAARLLERGTSELEQAGLSNARFQSELLLRHVLGWSRETLLARVHEEVLPETTGHFFQLVERRRGRVPIQYLLGSQEFYGLELRVTPAVLIPRPETEGVVDEAVGELGEHPRPRIADVGCGSGCIAIALAHALHRAEILAIDESRAALAVARENALRHSVIQRVFLLPGDLLEPVAGRFEALEAVVSNPPYIPDAELEGLEPEVVDHEPVRALAGGPDGLSVVRRLVPAASDVLAPGGFLFMEIGKGQDEAVREIVEEGCLELLRIAPDLAGIPRVVVARKA